MASGILHHLLLRPSLFFQCLSENMIKSGIFRNSPFEDRRHIIHILRADDHIDAPIKGGHIVHRPEPVRDQSHKNLPARRHGQVFQISEHVIITKGR